MSFLYRFLGIEKQTRNFSNIDRCFTHSVRTVSKFTLFALWKENESKVKDMLISNNALRFTYPSAKVRFIPRKSRSLLICCKALENEAMRINGFIEEEAVVNRFQNSLTVHTLELHHIFICNEPLCHLRFWWFLTVPELTFANWSVNQSSMKTFQIQNWFITCVKSIKTCIVCRLSRQAQTLPNTSVSDEVLRA